MSTPIRPNPDQDLWAMLHLEALPGSPRSVQSVDRVVELAVAEAEVLSGIGFRGFVVENFGDRPFLPGALEPVTLAAMTRVVTEVRRRWPDIHLVVNCLRNDARGALAVATAGGADAIRVNVHCGAMVTDQGILEGRAGETLRDRRTWGADRVRIFADVTVKHATPLAERPVAVEASDLRYRGAADALLVTGRATGAAADPEQVAGVREGAPDVPVIVASGVTVDNARDWAGLVDGAIVGSSLMEGGIAGNRVDESRAARLFEAWARARTDQGS
jgi:membrane complex biogenesis BtpA family protein